MEKILISACLLGQLVRYNAKQLPYHNETIRQWEKQGRLVPICPEVAGGLPTPRPPAEILGGSAKDVLEGRGKVVNIHGENVTQFFLDGAYKVLEVVEKEGIKLAILKEGSPSCGVYFIHNGEFNNQMVSGEGITTYLLRQNGVRVFNEKEISEAKAFLEKLESGS